MAGNQILNLALAGGAAFIAFRAVQGGALGGVLGGGSSEPSQPQIPSGGASPNGSTPTQTPSSGGISPSPGSDSPTFNFNVPSRDSGNESPTNTLPNCSTISAQRVVELIDQFDRGEIDPPQDAFADFLSNCSVEKLNQAQALEGG